jgi:hypothetical protein
MAAFMVEAPASFSRATALSSLLPAKAEVSLLKLFSFSKFFLSTVMSEQLGTGEETSRLGRLREPLWSTKAVGPYRR